MAFGFLTGILRIAKESIFSGMNNLKTNSILAVSYTHLYHTNLSSRSSCELALCHLTFGQMCIRDRASASVNILPMYVRRNTLRTREADFDLEPFVCVQDPLYIYTGNDYFHHDYYQKGYMSAQDEGSFAIAKFVDPKENERILDCCAAPGLSLIHI